MNRNRVMIVAARRTPLGAFQGQLAALSAPELGALSIRAVVADAAIADGAAAVLLASEAQAARLGMLPLARIVAHATHALRRRNLQRGIAALCIGGGEATAVALEVVQP